MQRTIKVGILGFGFVGQGVYNIIQEKQTAYQQYKTLNIQVHKILVKDLSKAERTLPENFDKTLLTDQFSDFFPSFSENNENENNTNDNPNALDYIFECTVGEQPALQYLTYALQQQVSVITANKVMFAAHGVALQQLADRVHQNNNNKKRVLVGYEATVAGGIPIIKTIQRMLPTQSVTKIEGILNGTTNFILTDLRENIQNHKRYAESLKEAQEKGYAEADPTNDVSGKDAFYKLMILSQLCFDKMPKWEEVELIGIETISPEMINTAMEDGGKCYRHVACIERKIISKIMKRKKKCWWPPSDRCWCRPRMPCIILTAVPTRWRCTPTTYPV
ncbi:homoserine dehydrogenase-like protein [Angomonas deanei]|nr:homoserine dehydrogenase-like protein [Angomonas deanei]|eukprot:EPY43659.1 homoserine dehydrogenase-like protein [Angomonas deanei]